MNQKQKQKQTMKKLQAQSASLRTNQQQASVSIEYDLSLEQAHGPFDWVEVTMEALGRYLFAGELTAPMTHTPKMMFDSAGRQSTLVRICHQGKYQNVCFGQPISPEQREEADEFFAEPKLTILKGN
jgi:hypothetical protein